LEGGALQGALTGFSENSASATGLKQGLESCRGKERLERRAVDKCEEREMRSPQGEHNPAQPDKPKSAALVVIHEFVK